MPTKKEKQLEEQLTILRKNYALAHADLEMKTTQLAEARAGGGSELAVELAAAVAEAEPLRAEVAALKEAQGSMQAQHEAEARELGRVLSELQQTPEVHAALLRKFLGEQLQASFDDGDADG